MTSEFDVGDKVLLLLSSESKKVLLQWNGPYEVLEVVNVMKYKNFKGVVNCYPANMLQDGFGLVYFRVSAPLNYVSKVVWYTCTSYRVEVCPCPCGYPGIRNMQPFVQELQFLCERIKIKGCTAFLSKVKHKFVNNSCSN